MTRRALAWGAALLLAAVACGANRPIVTHRTYAKTPGVLERLAVVPFYPARTFVTSQVPGGISAGEASELVARLTVEELQELGIRVIAPSDVQIAFEGSGQVVPRADAAAVAPLAAAKFGATSVLLGEVLRYREREGEALGSFGPASVGFQLTLYTAPEATRVWTVRFEETQRSITEDPLRARSYPGRGTRWLTAAELTRWGVDRAMATLPEFSR